MYIHEAVKQAMSMGLAITRTNRNKDEVCLWDLTAIIPTNTVDCCIIVVTDEKEAKRLHIPIGRRWNPDADDLMADDWELTDYKEKNDFITLIR